MNWRSTTYIEIQNQLRAYFAAMYGNDTTMVYLPNMACTHQGDWYICLNTTTGVFNPADWQLIPNPITQHGNYNPSTNYSFGDFCFHLGNLYLCQVPTTTGTFNPTQWVLTPTYNGQQFRQLRWIDLFNNQYNYIDDFNEELPFPLPAIFIEFHNTVWKNGVGGTQTGTCNVRIHVVLESYHESYHTSYDQAEALDRLNYLEQVQLCLQGFTGTYFSALNRSEEALDADHSNVIIHLFEYTTTITDNTSKPILQEVPIEEVHVNPEYDDTPVNGFDRLANETQTAINNNPPPPPPANNPFFIPQ